ncbi:MAG: ATP-binding protein [Microcystaceae cyanobacterium]
MFTASEINSSRQFYQQVASLLLYQSIFDDDIGKHFLHLLKTLHHGDHKAHSRSVTAVDCLDAYSNWFQALARSNQSWQDYLVKQVLLNDNPFSFQVQTQAIETLSPSLLISVKQDLKILQYIYQCSTEKVSNWVQTASQTPDNPIAWNVDNNFTSFLHDSVDWTEELEALADHYRKVGTGLFAQYRAFRWQDDHLVGIPYPDPISLQEIYGYDKQKKLLRHNTECLVKGYPSLHVLLYGSRGSGKSSMVKAIFNEYQAQGLRLIELNKQDLNRLPTLIEMIRHVPQSFIIFVDDLSFEEDDDGFKAMKVVLEGSVTARATNMAIYATSNRRHLIREFFSDRPNPLEGEEVHAWDTQQEKLSFSDRFGLTLTFEPANQDTYLAIVHHLAQQAGIDLPTEEIEFRAKQWTKHYNSRSGRTAKQFIDFIKGESLIKQENEH